MHFNIIRFESIESTNDTAMNGIYRHGDVVVARCQSCGRGQRGNSWLVKPGQNLTFSLVVEPVDIPVDEQFRISMMAALAASKAINLVAGRAMCKVKWPNDLYIGDQKIGGILIEHQLLGGDAISRSIIGIGVNVMQDEFDSSIPNPTSLSLQSVDTTPTALLSAFCEAFDSIYNVDVESLHEMYMQNLWRGDSKPYPYRDCGSGEQFLAEIYAVDPFSGLLTLKYFNAQILRNYWFKEVSAML